MTRYGPCVSPESALAGLPNSARQASARTYALSSAFVSVRVCLLHGVPRLHVCPNVSLCVSVYVYGWIAPARMPVPAVASDAPAVGHCSGGPPSHCLPAAAGQGRPDRLPVGQLTIPYRLAVTVVAHNTAANQTANGPQHVCRDSRCRQTAEANVKGETID